MTEQAEVVIDIDAAPENVWDALTSESGLAPWMGEGSSIDGDTLVIPDPVTDQPKVGLIRERQRDERFAFTWWPEGHADDMTHVDITLEPISTGTRVRVVESVPSSVLTARASWIWRMTALSVSRSCFVA